MRLIDADALDAKLKCTYRYFQIAGDIAEAPTIDPVKHGKWDDSLDGITPYCSVCGHTHRCLIRCPSYCPNCGAKMDEEE